MKLHVKSDDHNIPTLASHGMKIFMKFIEIIIPKA